MFDGVASEDKDPTQVHRRRRGAAARARARRGLRRGHGVVDQLQHGVDVDLRADVHVRVPRPARPRVGLGAAPRARPPRARLGRRRRGAARRLRGAALAPRGQGDGPLQLRGRPGPDRPTTTRCSRSTSGSGGSRPTSAGLADVAVVKANQLMPKPTHLSWEEAAVNALCNSTAYRMLVSRTARRSPRATPCSSGARRAGSAASRSSTCSTAAATPVGVVSSASRRRAAARARLRARHRPPGAGLPVLVRRAHPGRVRVAPARRGHPRARRHRPRHRLRAPGPPDDGRERLRLQPRRHGRHVRGDDGLHGRVRQPAPLDEAEDDQGQPLLELPRGVGREPARLRGQDRPAALGGLPARAGRRGRAGRSTATSRRASSACCCLAPSEGLGIDDPALRATRRRGRASRSSGGTRERAVLTEIDHVAIAVRDLDAAVALVRTTSSGPTVVHREVVASDGVEEALVAGRRVLRPAAHPDDATTRRSPGSSTRRGEGLHHVAYRVDDCAAALEAVKASGARVDRPGAAARLAGDDGRLRAPVGLLRHPHRARGGGPRLA